MRVEKKSVRRTGAVEYRMYTRALETIPAGVHETSPGGGLRYVGVEGVSRLVTSITPNQPWLITIVWAETMIDSSALHVRAK